ncbi:MAG: hypothetical protein R3C14_02035 [Caldilineaceae bacterium]
MDSFTPPLFGATAGLWVSFFFSLMIFSLIAGDRSLARLAQYILVGVTLGYLGALVWRQVLVPRLFQPLFSAPLATPGLWLTLILGLLLWIAGLERIWLRGLLPPRKHRAWRTFLRVAGGIPVALMLGITLSAVLIGLLQGTLWPQFWQAAHTGLIWSAPPLTALASLLVLLLTTATLLYWTLPIPQVAATQPKWVRRLLLAWQGVGQRALWFAAGVLFARLLAAQLSVVIERMQFFSARLSATFLWQWAMTIWQVLIGGGR